MTHERLREVAEEILGQLEPWACQCHAASARLVHSGKLGQCRVARGSCGGVAGQHSWVVLGDDCYDEDATIIDPTLWSYDDSVQGVWVGTYRDGRHTPHGKGSIWEWGRPEEPTGPVVTLTPRKPFSRAAENFLEILGPLDYRGWAVLANAPVEDWPAAEILDAIENTEGMAGLVPIDIIGMLTDRDPGRLYLAHDLR